MLFNRCAATFIAMIAVTTLAFATERWSCWVKAGKGAKGNDFIVDGTKFYRDSLDSRFGDGWKWKVLRNDNVAIAAIYVPEKGSSLYMWTVLINKVSGAYVYSQINEQPPYVAEHGRCWLNHRSGVQLQK